MQGKHVVFAAVILVVVAGLLAVRAWLSRDTRREASIEGTVVDPAGRPVAGATVYVGVNEGDPRGVVPPLPRAITVPGGSFRLDGVNFQPFLTATHPDYCDSAPFRVHLTTRGAQGIQLRLTEGGKVSGTLDPSQGPVADRRIWLAGAGYRYNGTTDP